MREEQFEIRLHNGPFSFSSTFVHGYAEAYKAAIQIAQQHYADVRAQKRWNPFDNVRIYDKHCRQIGTPLYMNDFLTHMEG